MEWIERLNQSINYIEEHLTDEIDYEQLGKITCCSSYHYQRMFTYMAGIPLSEYIRRRKMSLAAVDLRDKDVKIIDVSMKYGYSSPTAFNRAFQTIHGIAPSFIKYNISPSKSGYLVSYVRKNKTLASFVSRKTGMKLRIYPEHINEYQSFLDTMPNNIKKDIKKASVCKRLLNPDDCNPKCQMGYTFDMDEEHFVKCRYMAFMPTLSEDNNPYIMQFLERELTY